MKVRIHGTDQSGKPVEYTGDCFTGDTFLGVVEGMMLNPFTTEREPVAYMRRVLASIGGDGGKLPDEPSEAAEAFLSTLAKAGYAAFEPEAQDKP